MQLKFGTCQLRQDALQRKAVALLCRTEALQREPKEALQCRPGHGLLPQRVCCPQLCAMPVQHSRAPEQALEDTSPEKIDVTSKSPVGDISVVTLIRTDTTLDHSQKAEKVWRPQWECATHNKKRNPQSA